MAHDIDEALSSFADDSYTVRLCRGVFKILPFSPELDGWHSLDECVALLEPRAGDKAAARAREIALQPGPQSVLKTADRLDSADKVISMYTGVRGAVKLFKSKKGERAAALETDSPQATDAVLKGLGVAWIVHSLFEGSLKEKAAAFGELKSGRNLATYYAAIEVGLPFSDNALLGAGGFLGKLFSKHEQSQAAKLATVAGGNASEAVGMMHEMMGPIERMVSASRQYLGAVADTASNTMPGALDVADKAAGVVATGADLLPVYRYLVARLVAEYCATKALEEVGFEVEAEMAPVPEVKVTQSAPALAAATQDDVPPKSGGVMKTLVLAAAVAVLGCAGATAMLLGGGEEVAVVDDGSTTDEGASAGSDASSGSNDATRGGSGNRDKARDRRSGGGRKGR